MGFPRFRFTLNNAIEGSLLISEPGGWDEAVLKLERDKNYHSLVEFYDQPLLFYGDNLDHDAGISYIRNIEQTQGVEAQIELLVEISEDEGDTYETLFSGILDLSTLKEVDFYKLECGVIRNDFWSKFINRKSIPVDLESTTDLDGGSVSAVSGFTLPMPSQRIRESFYGYVGEPQIFGSAVTVVNNEYLQVDTNVTELNEIKVKYNIPFNLTSDALPVGLFEMEYGGNYLFEIEYYLTSVSNYPYVLGNFSTFLNMFIQKNNETPIALTEDHQTEYSKYSYSDTLTLQKGDTIRIYGQWITNFSAAGVYFIIWGNEDAILSPDPLPIVSGVSESFIRVTADTVYIDTETDAYLIKDAAESILSKLIGRNDVLYSEYFGDNSPEGCGKLFAIMKGLHVRGYSFADKPFFMSFDQWWTGANPIFNLGLGYEEINDVEYIRIEPKSHFYDNETSLNLDFVNNIERSYYLDSIFKSIEIGYNKWSAESSSGVDDPQSRRTYRTSFATVGKDEKVLSTYIAASLAIEQTRRNRIEQGKDWRLDEDVMIIALNEGSPLYVPEFDENFDSVTGLLNSDARYNIRLSVARNFERWLDYFSGCVQIPSGEEFQFTGGEGNYDMVTLLSESDCESDGSELEIDEKGNFQAGTIFLHKPIVWEFEHPLTYAQYKTIRDNRNKAIGVSRTDEGHIPFFIIELDYQITRGKAKFIVVQGDNRIVADFGQAEVTGYEPDFSIFVNSNAGLGQGTYTGLAPEFLLPPGAPPSVSEVETGGGNVDVSWDDFNTGGTPTNSRIEVDVNSGGFAFLANVAYPTRTYSDNSAYAPATTLIYRVRYENAAGNSSYTNSGGIIIGA